MKQLLITIAAVVLVGCGKSQQSATAPEAEPVDRVEVAKAPNNLIHKAAEEGNIEAVKQHLAAGWDVNAKDEDDWTPLQHAVFSKEVVELLNYYGIMIDISHPSKEAIRQMAELSKAPIIASHSSARALRDHPRNVDDEQLNWIKENGGVIQTTALGFFLTDREDPPANMDDFMDHIDYMVEKIGIDHVGISSDFDGGGGIVGWDDASETMNVTSALRERGYSESEIAKLWGGNLLRVLDEVQEIAAKLQS